MKHLSLFVLALLVIITFAGGVFVNAYFDLDESFIGKPTKTILPDGRIKYSHEPKFNQPFPKGVKLPQLGEADTGIVSSIFDDADATDAAQKKADASITKQYFSIKQFEAIMHPKWQGFKLDENTNSAKTICHDSGDKNMRMSIFGASAELVDALKNKKDTVFLYASATNIICHGAPIFRFVTAAHFFGDEILLVTSKASYEQLFDEAKIDLEIRHPLLTAIDSEHPLIFESGKEQGVSVEEQQEASVSTFGSSAVPQLTNRQFASDDANAVKTNNAHANAKANTEQQARVAKGQHFHFHHVFHHITHAISHAVHHAAHVVSHAVSKVTKAVGRGVKKVVHVVWSAVKILELNFDKNINKKLISVTKNGHKTLKGIQFVMNFHFDCGFIFNLNIQHGKLLLFKAAVFGDLNLGGTATLPRVSKEPINAQSVLWSIPGFKLHFMIGPVPIWLSYKTECLAGATVDVSYFATVGFQITSDAQLGVQYEHGSGFSVINNHDFTKTHTLQYDAELSAAPSLGAQAHFKMESMISAFAQLNAGINVNVDINSPMCKVVKITADFFIRISAGAGLDISILHHTLFSKNWGPYSLFNWNWPAINVCKNSLHKKSQQQRISGRIADVLSADDDNKNLEAISAVSTHDTGKVWNTPFTCAASNTTHGQISLTGFFDDNTTLMYVVVSRNITVPVSQRQSAASSPYDLYTQAGLYIVNSPVTAGSTYNFTYIPSTYENAQALGIDYSALEALSQSHGTRSSTVLPLDYLVIAFPDATNMNQVTVSNPSLCSTPQQSKQTASTLNNNQTVPQPPQKGSYFWNMLHSFDDELYPTFISQIHPVIIAALCVAVIEFILALSARKIVGAENWPTTATSPRRAEWIILGVSVFFGLAAMCVFIAGSSALGPFSAIGGARLGGDSSTNSNTSSSNSNDTTYIVDYIIWEFRGAKIAVETCPVVFGCPADTNNTTANSTSTSTNSACNQNTGCKTQYINWQDATWPACSVYNNYMTRDGRCIKFAWDAVANATLFVFFLFIAPFLTFKCSSTIYRRLLTFHGCLVLAGMCLNLIWRRIATFMSEVKIDMFDPADNMVMGWSLYMNPDSEVAWKCALGVYWFVTGVVGIVSIVLMYKYYKENVFATTNKRFSYPSSSTTATEEQQEPTAEYNNHQRQEEDTAAEQQQASRVVLESVTDASNANLARYHHSEKEAGEVALM